jgi:hypothetical protein
MNGNSLYLHVVVLYDYQYVIKHLYQNVVNVSNAIDYQVKMDIHLLDLLKKNEYVKDH